MQNGKQATIVGKPHQMSLVDLQATLLRNKSLENVRLSPLVLDEEGLQRKFTTGYFKSDLIFLVYEQLLLQLGVEHEEAYALANRISEHSRTQND